MPLARLALGQVHQDRGRGGVQDRRGDVQQVLRARRPARPPASRTATGPARRPGSRSAVGTSSPAGPCARASGIRTSHSAASRGTTCFSFSGSADSRRPFSTPVCSLPVSIAWSRLTVSGPASTPRTSASFGSTSELLQPRFSVGGDDQHITAFQPTRYSSSKAFWSLAHCWSVSSATGLRSLPMASR